jgi:hypothetical protein
MTFREFHRHRIFDFTMCEDAMQEPISESFDGTLDARAFDHINANTDHAHLTGIVGRFCETLRLGV